MERRDVRRMISEEHIQRLFAEQVGRRIESDVAEGVAQLVNGLVDQLRQVEPALLETIEPSLVFGACYPAEGSMRPWQRERS
jgi:hypothetical protein